MKVVCVSTLTETQVFLLLHYCLPRRTLKNPSLKNLLLSESFMLFDVLKGKHFVVDYVDICLQPSGSSMKTRAVWIDQLMMGK